VKLLFERKIAQHPFPHSGGHRAQFTLSSRCHRKRIGATVCRSSLLQCSALKPIDEAGKANYGSVSHFCMNRKSQIAARVGGETDTGPRVRTTAPELEPGAPSDLDLMQAIQAEDPEGLSLLYDRYNGILKALILRVIHNEAEADDLLQEIFMEIWNQAKNFSAQKGKPLGWMVTLARRRAIDGLRKKQAYTRAEERLQSETEQRPEAWMHNATAEEIAFSDTRSLVRKVINGLPPAQQQAIELAFFRGMSQREIAAKTNTPLGTVKTRLELGLKKIYDGLKELKDEL
jgi:RNA polymerase sigma-70 factor (ECF subfamily)